jgi:hypothetical protein
MVPPPALDCRTCLAVDVTVSDTESLMTGVGWEQIRSLATTDRDETVKRAAQR